MGRVIKASDLESKPIGISPEARQAAEILAKARHAAFTMREEAREDLVDLALHMAKRIVGRAVELDSGRPQDDISVLVLHVDAAPSDGVRRLNVSVPLDSY